MKYLLTLLLLFIITKQDKYVLNKQQLIEINMASYMKGVIVASSIKPSEFDKQWTKDSLRFIEYIKQFKKQLLMKILANILLYT